MGSICHIAASWDGDFVAVGAFEHRVAVWNITTGKKISEFDTVLDFGGNRLAICPNGRTLIASAYKVHGVCCYEATTGKLIWQRKDLKKLQNVAISTDNRVAYCGFEIGPGRALSMVTGEDLGSMPDLKQAIPSPFEPLVLLDKKKRCTTELRSLDGGHRRIVPRIDWSMGFVAFSPDYLITSEKGVRCFGLRPLTEVWHFVPEEETYANDVGFDERDGSVLAIMVSGKKLEKTELYRFDPASGRIRKILDVATSEYLNFCKRGRLILHCDGSLIDTLTGKLTKKLKFPRLSDG